MILKENYSWRDCLGVCARNRTNEADDSNWENEILDFA